VAPGPQLFGGDADAFMARLGALPLVHQPGERWLYHTGLDIAGVLVARASGMPLGVFQQERIFAPLGMADTGFHGPADRLATTYWRNPQTGEFEVWDAASGASFADPPPFEAGGGGHVSTIDDFHAFGRFLLDGGVANGRRLLSAELAAEMLTDQITPAQKAASPWFPADFWDRHGWGLGVALRTDPPARGRFGWWGGFGTAFWCDPATDTIAALFTQRMMSGADDTALPEAFLAAAFGVA
jgi:CubicO group peptidase (beta-lactamase class C family)